VLRIEGEPHILAVTRDISARIRAEEALKASEARFRTLIEASPEAVLLARDGWMLMVNRAFLHMTGYAEEAAVLGRSLLDFLAPEERPRVAGFVAARTNGKPAPNHYEALGLRRDGRVFPFEISVAQVDLEDGPATLAYVRDVTRRKAAEDARTELEAQLRQAQKLESVGRLAGGVAHDFNNLLTAIKGNLELVLNDLDRLDPARERLTEIQLAAESAEALTRQLLAFSRQQIIEPRVLSLNDLLVNLEKMLRRLLGADIDLVLTLDPRLRTVKVDAGQVEQIILNLAVNARDAMPRGGTLGLSTENMESTGSRDLEPGQYVRLRVSDNGTGMTDEIKSHLFEPFYTTKGRDKGTGLGLATVYGMVQQNRGTISVHSVCEEGTSFDLLFPVTEEAPREPVVLDTSKVLGGETVLLVEDEPMVRDLARRFLLRLGYQVLDCGSGPEALALVAKHPQVIHLLLTDVIMPGMSGKVLADHLKPLHPETRVLFTSGYTVDEITTHGILEEGLAFLSKPYSLKTLGDKIRLVLA
jgi:PAS domain S-box-containing protein